MTEAYDLDRIAREAPPHRKISALRPGLSAVEALLGIGGDARISISKPGGVNRYGCPTSPSPDVVAFGSSTASIVSEAGFAAAEVLRERLLASADRFARARTYREELDRLRDELKGLCGLDDMPDLGVLFAASGTDLHLIVGELAAKGRPLVSIGVESTETGSGVALALAGRHFSSRTALGRNVDPGEPIGTDASSRRVVPIDCREPDGALRLQTSIGRRLEAATCSAILGGARVLLVVTDVSKTGLISPSIETVLAMRNRWPNDVEVLIDACQFRLSPESLRAYLDAGCMVAVTGSKFLTGPSFSAALFAPGPLMERLPARLAAGRLATYCSRAEWPGPWAVGAPLPETENFGLLMRWEAALCELRAFRAVAPEQSSAFLGAFSRAVQARLTADPAFEPLPIRPPDRRPLVSEPGWDAIPTIFPFMLRDPRPQRSILSRDETDQVYRTLRDGPDHVHLGQPVACGARHGAPISALRLCASARLVVEAANAGPDGHDRIIRRAMDSLDATAVAIHEVANAGG